MMWKTINYLQLEETEVTQKCPFYWFEKGVYRLEWFHAAMPDAVGNRHQSIKERHAKYQIEK